MMVRLAVRGDYAMVAKAAMMAMMLMMRSWRSWRSWQDDDGEDKIAVIEMIKDDGDYCDDGYDGSDGVRALEIKCPRPERASALRSLLLRRIRNYLQWNRNPPPIQWYSNLFHRFANR